MAIDVAFSIEANNYIDPDRAYDLYWSGIITDKKKFICPGTACTAQVTCANLDEDLQNMKVVPHYRIYGQHSDNCEIFNNKPLNLQYDDGVYIKEERRTVDESIVDIFLLDRPDFYYDEVRSNLSNNRSLKKPEFVRRSKDTRLREAGSIGNIYSVRSVVGRYIRYRQDGSINQRRINILGKDIYYQNIFKCIWEQDLDDLPSHPAIYYGWAYVNRLRDDSGYQIKFKKKFKKGKDGFITTTIIIADRLIESYKIKKLMTTRLEKINQNEKPTAFIFVYAKPEESVSRGVRYANFSITNLDMIDINYDCPLPKEYNK